VPATCLNTCGAPGAACCAGNNCQANFRCITGGDAGAAGACEPCGAPNQRCCNRGQECRAGSACVGTGAAATCQACGGSAQACCEGRVCNAGFVCRVPTGTMLPERCEPMM
jgi:hypothetical protein